jgi:hypothetical protein
MDALFDDRALAETAGCAVMALGGVFTTAGVATWAMISSGLREERITVADDASHFAGQRIDSPWTAWQQAATISRHIAGFTNGKTYAELDREDPLREIAMDGSLLRSALFTSIIGFGVAAAVTGIGVTLGVVGYGIRKAALA